MGSSKSLAEAKTAASGRNIRMTLEYEGCRYVGWQRQKNGISVQQRVEEALSRHLGETVRVTAAGRTDAGVHALGQVINFHTSSSMPEKAILRGALQYLPRDITFSAIDEVPPGFSARSDARLRWYRYFVLNRSVGPAVASSFLTHVPYRLNVRRMEAAAEALEGQHDFRAFRASSCTAARTILTMHRPQITLLPDDVILFDFKCRSFLQNMVRIMLGILVACGRGRMETDEIEEMFRTGDRAREAVTLPPNGLFLYRVFYEDEIPGAARQADPLQKKGK